MPASARLAILFLCLPVTGGVALPQVTPTSEWAIFSRSTDDRSSHERTLLEHRSFSPTLETELYPIIHSKPTSSHHPESPLVDRPPFPSGTRPISVDIHATDVDVGPICTDSIPTTTDYEIAPEVTSGAIMQVPSGLCRSSVSSWCLAGLLTFVGIALAL